MTKYYDVLARPIRPAYGDQGAVMTFAAKSKKEAISEMRAYVKRHCLYDRHDGPLTYTATETN